MAQSAKQNMTIFLNHSYDVPEDVAGSVEMAFLRSHPTDPEIQDLTFDIIVNESNERAVKAWEAIDGGTKLGLSIGARIPDRGATRSKDTGRYTIDHVDLLETSIVGVPANLGAGSSTRSRRSTVA
jgi:phage head maturation protease